MTTLSAPSPRATDAPFLGVGVGLRPKHYAHILAAEDSRVLGVDFFEVLSENYMVPGGRPLRVLTDVRARFPIALHGVSLNIGSADPLQESYLEALKTLAWRFEPAIVSDHLCSTGVDGRNLHDLVPLPYTEAALHHVADRVSRVQDLLGRTLALENVSSYFAYVEDAMPEWEFLSRVAERARPPSNPATHISVCGGARRRSTTGRSPPSRRSSSGSSSVGKTLARCARAWPTWWAKSPQRRALRHS